MRTIWIRLLLALSALAGLAGVAEARGDRQSFDQGWKFRLDAPSEAAGPGYDDAAWRTLDLPHDWSIEGVPDPDAPAGNAGGYYPTGCGWYRKTFDCALPSGQDRRFLYFEGVYMNAEVFVNGQPAGGHPYGFTSFRVDLTPFLVPGRNLVAVKVDNSAQPNCRWYSGSGIYRHVWLVDEPAVHFEHQGTFVTTPEAGADGARVHIATAVVNGSGEEVRSEVGIVLRLAGREVARCVLPLVAAVGQTVPVGTDLHVSEPQLWSPSSPVLYEAELTVAGHRETTRFGIRSLRWNAAEGFLLNGERILLNGSCVHSDNGILGVASFDAAEYRRVRQLKDAGFNAVRTSHNPPSPAFLDACDEIGLLVIDESFDGWRTQKNPYDYSRLFSRWYKEDVQAMVRRDRNHPSIVMWSTGNEVIERKELRVLSTARLLSDAILEQDATRPVTSALASWDRDWEIYDPLAAQFDIVGYNYMIHKAEGDHERVPDRVIAQTESYPVDAFRNWAAAHDHAYIIGDFVWTGLDYIGESGIGKYYYKGDPRNNFHLEGQFPYHGAYCGDIDLTGWRKPISHYREMLWTGGADFLYLCAREPDGYHGEILTTGWAVYPTWESWQWPGWEGKPVQVEVYTKSPEVRLYLNDRLVGVKQVDRSTEFKAVFDVPYEPGTLRAEAGGQVRTLSTPGDPYAIRLSCDAASLSTDPEDLGFVTVEIVDRQGRVCPEASREIRLSVSGGRLQAVGNANLEDTGSYVDDVHATWKGRALAIVRSPRKVGKCRLTVTSPGLKSATLTLPVI